MDCVDLRTWAESHRFRWRFEDSYRAEKDPATRGDGRRSVEVICRRGLIYPWGEDDLLAFTGTLRVLPRLLAVDPAVRTHQRGDRESVVRFPSRLLDQVAAVMEPRRRRTLDPERARAIGQASAYGAQARESEVGRTQAAPDDPQAVPSASSLIGRPATEAEADVPGGDRAA